jgi:hypothetical protein
VLLSFPPTTFCIERSRKEAVKKVSLLCCVIHVAVKYTEIQHPLARDEFE